MTSLPGMVRTARILTFFLCACPAILMAQEAAKPSAPAEQTQQTESTGDQIEDLRQMLDQQSKQIDVLAQEIARLNLLLEGKNGNAMAPAPATDASAQAPALARPATPPKAVAADAPAAPEPTPGGPVHIVTKGETLTAIAKHYKVTVPELLKLNKIADVRRLQIGQTVFLPPDAKIPPSPSPTASPNP